LPWHKTDLNSPPPNITGIVGTAKNTGKTTTLSYLLTQASRHGVIVGVTSIGYDGEDIDNVTSLPKPRITLEPGTIATTTELCLPLCTAGFEILSRTGIMTALGEILVLRISRKGLVVIAGPHKRNVIEPLLDELYRHGAAMIFVDGALNRISPLFAASQIVFTTGAARHRDPRVLAGEMSGIERLFSLPLAEKIDERINMENLLDEVDVDRLTSAISPETRSISLSHLVSLTALTALSKVHLRSSRLLEIVVPDPLILLLAGEPEDTVSALDQMQINGIHVTYRRKPALTAVTVNPFYPDLQLFTYSPAYIDKKELLTTMRKALSIPVFDIKDDGAESLFSLLAV
jgi:hypothetical protein